MSGGDPEDIADDDSNLFLIGTSLENTKTHKNFFGGFIYEIKFANYYMPLSTLQSEVAGTCTGT